MIYINEAHSEIWPIGEAAGVINQSHKKIDDRINCAIEFKKKHELFFPIYCDSMNDTFEIEYASWPFRYFVITNGKIQNIGYPVESHFDLTELFDFISEK